MIPAAILTSFTIHNTQENWIQSASDENIYFFQLTITAGRKYKSDNTDRKGKYWTL